MENSFMIWGFTFNAWTVFGFAAQFVFLLRVLLQWIISERARKSIVPVGYWYLSVVGSIMISVYAFHIRDIVFFSGQALALLIYLRNIYLIWYEHKPPSAID